MLPNRRSLKMIQILMLGTLSLSATAGGGLGEQPGLEGPQWRLVELVGAPLGIGEEDRPTLLFEQGGDQVSGYTGCNPFVGSYRSAGALLEISQFGKTMRACDGLHGEVELAFLDGLDRVDGYRITGGALELLAGGQVIARFTQAGHP